MNISLSLSPSPSLSPSLSPASPVFELFLADRTADVRVGGSLDAADGLPVAGTRRLLWLLLPPLVRRQLVLVALRLHEKVPEVRMAGGGGDAASLVRG